MGKRYLMRASMSPLDNPTAAEAIGSDLIWGNTGNLLFFQSVYRALLTDSETVIDCIDVDREYDRSQAEEINEKYDAFIVPLANAFRKSFARGLSYLTSLIEKLSIPVIVIGVGYQGGLREDITASRSWDEGVRRFCKAVLKHSAGIGIRGEISIAFKEKLEALRDVKVVLWDERLTTVTAQRSMIASNMNRQKRKKMVDTMAAVIILQSYLDSRK